MDIHIGQTNKLVVMYQYNKQPYDPIAVAAFVPELGNEKLTEHSHTLTHHKRQINITTKHSM
jgi:hypothetical protein